MAIIRVINTAGQANLYFLLTFQFELPAECRPSARSYKAGVILAPSASCWVFVPQRRSQDQLVAVWDGARRGIFAVSDRGGIIRFDGASWKVQGSRTCCLSTLFGGPSLGVLAAGCHGTILRLEESRRAPPGAPVRH